jgi:hypothetical protein
MKANRELSGWLSIQAKWEAWAVEIRGPDVDGLDTPKAKRSQMALIVEGRIAMYAWKGIPYSFAKSFTCSI